MNQDNLNPMKVIQALEDQMRALTQEVESLAGTTLTKAEAEKLHENLVTIHNDLVSKFRDMRSLSTDQQNEALRLATQGSEVAIQKEMEGVRDDLRNASQRFTEAASEVRDNTWVKRTYIGIGGATIFGLILVFGSYALTSRDLNLSSKQAELARLDQAINNNAITIEKQKLEYDQLKSEVSQLDFQAEVISRIRESTEFTNAVGGGVEIYLKEGWGTERCELANGSTARKCIRRD